MAVRRNLKVFRAKLGLTQNEIADKMGVARSMYGQVENGRRNYSTTFMKKLQKAFNIHDSDIINLLKVESEE